MQEDLQKALIAYNKKTWCKSALLGFFVGLAVIVPGISGSTVAIIFKLYDAFLYAVSNLFKQFRRCFFFLLPIAIGIVIGLAAGFFTVQKALEYIPFAIVGGFAGLMCGAFPAVTDELKGAERTPKRVALFLAGVAIPVAAANLFYSAFRRRGQRFFGMVADCAVRTRGRDRGTYAGSAGTFGKRDFNEHRVLHAACGKRACNVLEGKSDHLFNVCRARRRVSDRHFLFVGRVDTGV